MFSLLLLKAAGACANAPPAATNGLAAANGFEVKAKGPPPFDR